MSSNIGTSEISTIEDNCLHTNSFGVSMKKATNESARKGIKDVWWRPSMVKGAVFGKNDIPFCPTTKEDVPEDVVSFSEATKIYRERRRKNREFQHPAYVFFYEDGDSVCYGSKSCIWIRYRRAYEILRHFAGIITPIFVRDVGAASPWERWNTYCMRAFGYRFGKDSGKPAINSVCWSDRQSYQYCFEGIPENSIVAIRTDNFNPNNAEELALFEKGLRKMTRVLSPHTIIVYGAVEFQSLKRLAKRGVKIIPLPPKTFDVFLKGGER